MKNKFYLKHKYKVYINKIRSDIFSIPNYLLEADLSILPKSLLNDLEVARLLMEQRPYNFHNLSKHLRNNKDLAYRAVKYCGDSIDYVGKKLLNDKELVLLSLLDYYSRALKICSYSLRNDKDFVIKAVSTCSSAIQYIPKKFQSEKELFYLSDANYETLEYASIELKNDFDLVLNLCSRNGLNLKYASTELKHNEDIVCAALKSNGNAIEFTPWLISDYSKALESVNSKGNALKHLCEDFKDNLEIVLAAINDDPFAIEFASDRLKGDPDLALKVINKEWMAFQYLNENIKSDMFFIREALLCYDKEPANLFKAIHGYTYVIEYTPDSIKEHFTEDKDPIAVIDSLINYQQINNSLTNKSSKKYSRTKI